MQGIKVLMAKNYIDNLSEETRKGMLEEASQGIWPSYAPLGYRNVVGADGRKVIEPDPEVAPTITRLFEWYAPGRLSLREVAKRARAAGMAFRGSGRPVSVSTVQKVLRNRLYMGEFEWDGRRYEGKHQPIVSRELWQCVQHALDGRLARRTRKVKHQFAFSGLIQCGHCGCAVVGEIKKGRYVYYHCSGYKGRCPEPYVREEVLEERFTELLGRLRFDDEVLDWVRQALRQSLADERRDREEAVARLQAEYDRLQARIEAMYIDKLDGRVDAAFFDRMAKDWRDDQRRCLADIERHQAADQSYLDSGVHLLELAQNAQNLFAKQVPAEKGRLLDFLVSNCTWKAGELTATFSQPFDMLAETKTAAGRAAEVSGLAAAKSEIWLPGPDSNQRPSG